MVAKEQTKQQSTAGEGVNKREIRYITYIEIIFSVFANTMGPDGTSQYWRGKLPGGWWGR